MDGVTGKSRIGIPELEKHISDYRKSKPELSADTARKLPRALNESAFQLAELNPLQSLNYNLFTTALSYSAKARYVKNIDDALPHIKKLIA